MGAAGGRKGPREAQGTHARASRSPKPAALLSPGGQSRVQASLGSTDPRTRGPWWHAHHRARGWICSTPHRVKPRGKGPQVAPVASWGQWGPWRRPWGRHTHLAGHHPELHSTAVAFLGVHPVRGLGAGGQADSGSHGPRPGQDPIVGSGAEGPVCEAGAHPKRALLCTGVSADSLRLGGSIRPSHTSPPGELRSKRSPWRRGCPAHASFLRQNGSRTSWDPGTSLLLP